MDACGGSGGSLENEGGDFVARGCNDTTDDEAHVATAVIFEGVPNFEIISGSGTTSRVNNEGTERETLSVRCTSLGNDGEMIVNTIEVTTDELRSMGQLNSEEVELVYSPNNVQFQVAAVEGDPSNNVGNELELGSIEELETFSRIVGVGETSTALHNQEPRLVIQQGFNSMLKKGYLFLGQVCRLEMHLSFKMKLHLPQLMAKELASILVEDLDQNRPK